MPKKLLYTASTYSHIVNFHLPYLAAFRAEGWEVHVACGGAVMDLSVGADQVFHMPFAKKMTAPENLRCARALGRLMDAQGYDLVITHTALAAFFTRLPLLGRRDRSRVVNTVHGYLFGRDTHPLKKAVLLAAERLTAPCTDLVLTMNAEDFDLARRHRLGREVRAIPGMGVDLQPLDQPDGVQGAALRASLGLKDDAYLLFYAAEFSKRKNQAFLIRAMADLPARAVLLLAGQGGEWEACRELARSLDLEGRVLFPGQVGDTAPYYRAADCAVSSSRSEGLPFNIMEAMGAGLPVVASAVKGHRDLLEEGRGLLYPPEDRDAFTAEVKRLMGDSALAARLGQSAREAAEPLRLERVLPAVLAAYGLTAEPERMVSYTK